MRNERLHEALKAKRIDAETLASAVHVEPRTVQRWLAGVVPHPRHRYEMGALLNEDIDDLWPDTRQPPSTASVTAEVVAVYRHRAELPQARWSELLHSAQRSIDLVAYAMLFLPEQHPDLPELLRTKGENACRIRIALADPASEATRQRDQLESLQGTLPARIQTTLHHLQAALGRPGVEIHFHTVPLDIATYRFDDEMLATPYVYGLHGFQHPLLHLRRLGPAGLFATLEAQFERIWQVSREIGAPSRTLNSPDSPTSEGEYPGGPN